MQGKTHLAQHSTPGFEHPRWSRIRFMTADPASGDTGNDGDNTEDSTEESKDSTDSGTQADDVSSLPEWAQKQIADLRKENAADRTNAKTKAAEDATKALTESIGKALGLIKDGDTAPTAEQLTAQLATSTGAATDAQRELAVFKAAATVTGADATTLLDSRAFLTTIKDIEPTDSAALKTAIEKALTDNPRLKSSQAAGKSGGDLTGGTGESGKNQPLSLTAAVNAALSPK